MSVARQEVKVHPAVKQWAEMCADPALDGLPYKFETDRLGKIIMSPASYYHARYQGKTIWLLRELLPHGTPTPECAILTSNGIKSADVAWMSHERERPYLRSVCLPVAPEICVEMASPSNSKREMAMKKRLYFAAGASEVWLCDKLGNMTFFSSDSEQTAIPQSKLCPAFPVSVETHHEMNGPC